MKGKYTNGKIESFGMRLVQWQDTRGYGIQARMNHLGELRWSVQNLQIQGDLNRLLQTIEDGTAYSGTDGSYKDEHGTAAFRIQNDLGDQITGCNITPGLQEHQSAYRSELGGIVGILMLTKATVDAVYQWVEGHQADRYGNQQLDKYGLLNDKMDKLANQYREETKHINLPPQQIISDQEGSLWIAD
jgi:hypothetical protein